MVGDFLAPHHFAGVFVQGHQLGVEGAEEHQVAVQRHAAVDHVTARADVIGQTRIVLPELLAGACVHREHPRVGPGEVHHPVLDHRLRLLAALFLAAKGERPDRAQVLDVVHIQGIERAIALALDAQTVGDDLPGVFRVLENLLIGHGRHGLAG